MTTPLADVVGKADGVAPDARGLFANGREDARAWVQKAHDLNLAVHVCEHQKIIFPQETIHDQGPKAAPLLTREHDIRLFRR